MSALKDIQTQLRRLANPEVALLLQRFFKTGAGEYGEGDIFLGIKVPTLRALIKNYRGTPPAIISTLLQSHLHEERLFALLLLVDYYQHGSHTDKQRAYEAYLSHTDRINNWDLVDISAPHIVGHYLANQSRHVLYTLVQSNILWERRIAIISTLHFIRCREYSDTLQLAERLLLDRQDLIHKATGWMLREVGKREQAIVEEFLQQHASHMPRTMLRYAIERFPETLRKHYLNLR